MVLILRKAAATYHTREVRVEHPKKQRYPMLLDQTRARMWSTAYYFSRLLVYAVPQVAQPYFMVLMSWRCLSHVYRDVLRFAPQAALCAPAGYRQSDRFFDNTSPGDKAVLHLVSVRSHTTRTPRGLGPPDLDFVLDSLAGPSERTMAQCGAFKRQVQRIWRPRASCPPSCMGWARSLVRGQAALDGQIPGQARPCLR